MRDELKAKLYAERLDLARARYEGKVGSMSTEQLLDELVRAAKTEAGYPGYSDEAQIARDEQAIVRRVITTREARRLARVHEAMAAKHRRAADLIEGK